MILCSMFFEGTEDSHFYIFITCSIKKLIYLYTTIKIISQSISINTKQKSTKFFPKQICFQFILHYAHRGFTENDLWEIWRIKSNFREGAMNKFVVALVDRTHVNNLIAQ